MEASTRPNRAGAGATGKGSARPPVGLRAEILEDARMTALGLGETWRGASGEPAGFATWLAVARLAWRADAFSVQIAYRLRCALRRHRVPLLPRLLHRSAMRARGVGIGEPVTIGAGLYLLHGRVTIDGITTIGRNCRIAPDVTIGLRAGDFRGPRIGNGVAIGTGAKIIGPVTIGSRAEIGAGAVVVSDVPEGTVAVGVPAVAKPPVPAESSEAASPPAAS